ncbi:MAG TPA: IS66 family transposase [Burkholderiaceae bacterium]|nr:IS66 family transposase [Burkholderiaceae bacterium]
MSGAAATIDRDVLEAIRTGSLSEPQARAFASRSPEVIIFTLLALAQQARGAADGAHTPSATIPPYRKPEQAGKRKPRGGQPGHAGHSRPRPERIDRRQTHQLPCCPECHGKLVRTGDTRTRITEDMPTDLKAEVTKHTLHRDWCPRCKKRVEPRLPEVLPHCTLGNRLLGLSAWMHYGNGSTLRQITEVLNFHLQIQVTEGGLVQMWHRLADVLFPWYEQIHRDCLAAAVLNADETGWRVNGTTHWLWCFTQPQATYYLIDRSRGHPALEKFFVEEFAGVLVTDFWAAYDAIACGAHQRCWPHLLRELKEVEAAGKGQDDWPSFARRLRRIYADGVKLRAARAQVEDFDLAAARLERRVIELAIADWGQPDAARLAGRLHKYGEELLSFLADDAIPPDNNAAERAIRPAVLIRKNSYANQSDRGALTQAVLMSIYRTLRQRRRDPLATLLEALHQLATTGKLPPLPPNTSEG